MITDARSFLDAVRGYTEPSGSGDSSDGSARATKLATIDPSYTSGPARVSFDGEGVVSTKTYTFLDPYYPVGGDRVLMIPSGSTYVIAGSVKSTATVPDTGWIPITYAASWATFSADYSPLRIRRIDKTVHLQGMVSTSIARNSDSTLIGTIPVGYRSSHILIVPTIQSATTTRSFGPGAAEILMDGRIICHFGSVGGGPIPAGGWVNLTTLSWPIG